MRRPNTLVVGMPYDAEHFNEAYRNYTGGGGYYVANNIFNRLVVLDIFGDAGIEPDLAERWEVLDDGTTYRFHLRRDVRWHDGAPFTAADVRYTYATAIERGHQAAVWLGDVRDLDDRDAHTVDIRLREPNAGFLAKLGIFVATHILPSHLYAGTDWATNPVNSEPVGTGPYRFVEWRRGELVRVAANATYHRGRPAVDEVEFRVVPGVDDALDGVIGGDIDYAMQYAPCERLAELTAAPGVAVAESSGNALGHLSFNLDRAPWRDRRVREAVACAIDSRPVAAGCPNATAERHAYLPRIGWAYSADAEFPAYDPARAAALLDAAGFQPDPAGVRIRGRLFARDLFRFYADACTELARQLARVGIALEVERLGTLDWKARVQEGRDFDLVFDGGDIGPDPSFLEPILGGGGRLNLTGYAEPAFDGALRRGRATVERGERAAAYRDAQALLVRDMPRVHLVLHGSHLAYRTEWTGWSWTDGVRGSLPFWSLERVRAVGAQGQRAA